MTLSSLKISKHTPQILFVSSLSSWRATKQLTNQHQKPTLTSAPGVQGCSHKLSIRPWWSTLKSLQERCEALTMTVVNPQGDLEEMEGSSVLMICKSMSVFQRLTQEFRTAFGPFIPHQSKNQTFILSIMFSLGIQNIYTTEWCSHCEGSYCCQF